ncbi:MAG TPA: alpha/beta hydrolase-fold protein, partial [Actinomycetota bacterium]|nr:alpha/beta hydrolase-fold protein [Actinomycetota bacterium]
VRTAATRRPATAADGSAGSLSDSAPPAARRAEPSLPAPAGWPFPEVFPRTSGTGRLAGGALLWTDFIYDDRGARSHPVATPVTPLAWPRGTYEYADPDAAANGADIFRAGIGLDDEATYWRVDWNTLIDPAIPAAMFALDLDGDASTGATRWPADAGIRSAGIERAIFVTSAGAWLYDLAAGTRVPLPAPAVEIEARSFVVRVPMTVLPVWGTWRVRLASGLATGDGEQFAPVSERHGARRGGPSIYNVGFRTNEQERPVMGTPKSTATMSYWMEHAQAAALAEGDVSAFFADVDWSLLQSRSTTPEPQPRGWSSRWYVSSIELGQGIIRDEREPQDGRPNYLGRVQPYAIFVPSSYAPGRPAPLTWLLHSAFQPHTAFAAMTPAFAEAACEQRGNICVTPLGRGHDGWFFDEAELDFWEVWGSVARAYSLDSERTVIAGYSMGGFGAYRIGLSHPDLFARVAAIAATQICGERFAPGVDHSQHPGPCTTDADTTPLLENARHLPVFITHGTTDELLPFTGALLQARELDRLGYRYRFEHALGQPHIPWYMQDAWFPAAEGLGEPVRESSPARATLRWYPNADRPEWGMAVRGAWWMRELRAARIRPGLTARVDAHSHALPNRTITPQRATYESLRSDSTPILVEELTWLQGGPRPRRATVTITLENVAAALADLRAAGLRSHEGATLSVTTDEHTTFRFTGLAGTVVVGGTAAGTAVPDAAFEVSLPPGTHTIRIVPPPR